MFSKSGLESIVNTLPSQPWDIVKMAHPSRSQVLEFVHMYTSALRQGRADHLPTTPTLTVPLQTKLKKTRIPARSLDPAVPELGPRAGRCSRCLGCPRIPMHARRLGCGRRAIRLSCSTRPAAPVLPGRSLRSTHVEDDPIASWVPQRLR